MWYTDGVGEKFNIWPRAASPGRCGEDTPEAGRRLRLGWRRQPRGPGHCAGSGSGRRVGTEAEKLPAGPTGQGSVWQMDKLFKLLHCYVLMSCNLNNIKNLKTRARTAFKVRWRYLLSCTGLSSTCVCVFSTANKSYLNKLAVIAVVQNVSVVQHNRWMYNVSQNVA